jgi:hypothetical protein
MLSIGIRVFQIQRWNFEHEVGRYWNRGLRSYLRNETNFYAIEGRIWGLAVKCMYTYINLIKIEI